MPVRRLPSMSEGPDTFIASRLRLTGGVERPAAPEGLITVAPGFEVVAHPRQITDTRCVGGEENGT